MAAAAAAAVWQPTDTGPTGSGCSGGKVEVGVRVCARHVAWCGSSGTARMSVCVGMLVCALIVVIHLLAASRVSVGCAECAEDALINAGSHRKERPREAKIE
eukprot:4130806-Prymnesium_polylepis.1